MNFKKHILVVAGGSGKRMLSETPKQYLCLAGVPLIAITINRLILAVPDAVFTVVIAEKDRLLWEDAKRFIQPGTTVNVSQGGPERFHSVKSGLANIRPDDLVAIHDAVRPLFSTEMIISGFQVAANAGAAVPVIELNESLREIDGALSKPVDRARFRLCQTPQFFKGSIILDAYRQSYQQSFTDDASVVQAAGYTIRLIEGNYENIKITKPADFKYAEALLNSMSFHPSTSTFRNQ